MSQGSWRPVDGDEIATTAAAGTTPAEDDVHTAETSAAPVFVSADEADGVERTARPRRPLDWRSVALLAVLVLVALQLAVSFLALGSINQVRDQLTTSNGLQKCLIAAQLQAQTSNDTAAYATAVKACLSK